MTGAERPVLGRLGVLVPGTAVFFGGWFVARTSAAGVSHDVAIALLGLAAATIAVVAVARWRVGLYLLLVWLVLDDLPRKFLGNDLLVYFGKDLLATAVYLGFFLELRAGRVRLFRPAFLAPLLFFACVCGVQALNPNSPSPLYGLLGLKLYLYYVPLMFLGHALIRTERDLRDFLVFNLGLAGVVGAIGVVQGIVGPSFLNPTTTPDQLTLLRLVRQAPLTGELVPRPTSVFVSDGRFAWYMLLALFLAVGTLAYASLRSGRSKLVAGLTLALTVVAILLSGSRGTFVYALASLLIFGGALVWGLGGTRRSGRVALVARTAVAVGGAAAASAVFFPDALGARWAFYYQTIAPWSPASELVYRTTEYPVGGFLAAFSFPEWPLGYGIGTASLGVQYLTSIFDVPQPSAAIESGYGALVLEMGLPGLVAWLAWTAMLVWASWKVVRTLRRSPLFPVAFAIFWFAFVLLFPLTYGGIQPYQNFIFNALLWLLVGVLFRLPELNGKRLAADRLVAASASP